MLTFRIGQKVVCIYAGPWLDPMGNAADTNNPCKGTTYTIRDIRSYPCGFAGLYLEEIINAHLMFEYHSEEPSFFVERFRPLIERATDISALTALLNPVNHTKLPEDALTS